jgi:hypothetical protein
VETGSCCAGTPSHGCMPPCPAPGA